MSFNPPPATGGPPPQFVDIAACRAWIKRLPLLNPSKAQAQLLDQLRTLNGFALPATLRLPMLEALQEPVRFVQEESVSLFAGKPLPLAPVEQSAIEATHQLWQALLSGYLRCLDEMPGEQISRQPVAALLCQRALAIMTDDFADQVRAGRPTVPTLWRLACDVFRIAEKHGASERSLQDPAREEAAVSPAMAFAELILVATASLHELPPRQQRWVLGWARRWAGKLKVVKTPPNLAASLPLCVDLDGADPPGFMPRSGAGARWLDTTELHLSMKRRLAWLAQSETGLVPAHLGLGNDCIQPACGEVLRRTYPRWVKGGVQRRYERHPMGGHCRFVAGVDAIHYYVSGHRPFKPPGSVTSDELRRQREELALFGRVATRFDDERDGASGFPLENWTVIEDWGLFDRSEDGLRLVRPLAQAGGRLGIGQLVAFHPAVGKEMLLGVVRWTQIDNDQFSVGIQVIKGQPLAVAVRRTGVMAKPDPYLPGFLLPAAAESRAEAGLILAPGTFKAGRIVETWTPIATQQFKLLELIERGADFERATCVATD